MVEVNNLSVSLQGQNLLTNISCRFPDGTITALIGKSGAGKTTLLRSIVGLIPQESMAGQVSIQGRENNRVSARARAELVGFVFQDFNLFDNLTVLQNCIDPQIVHGVDPRVAQQRALQVLTELSIEQLGDRYPGNISGGQKQRVAIARALCLQPQALLLDEPSASLDPENTHILVGVLNKLASQGLTIIFSSQDMDFVRSLAEGIYLLENGRVLEHGDPAQGYFECCERIQAFIR